MTEERARASYVAGDLEGCVSAWEDLYADRLGAGDHLGAARAAVTVATYLLVDSGLMAPVRGWLRRADRLLEPYPATEVHAAVAALRAYERFFCGDVRAAQEHATRAVALGERYGDASAIVIGETALARIALTDGRVDEGLAMLDEIGARLMAGEADPLTTGMMLCEIVCAAQNLAMPDLAREWTDAMERWGREAAIGGLHGRCRVHRAELLRMSGTCDAAEAEALGACADLRPWMRREYGWPLVELGVIRLRRGDLEGAEQAFLEAAEHAWTPQPGLALLHLARGDVDTAAAMVAEAIAHPMDIPWKERPPTGDLQLAPLYDAQAEIAFAAGDPKTCSEAAGRLGAIAGRWPSRALQASAALATARSLLLAGDLEGACHAGGRAVVAWAELGAPYEVATARVVLGLAHARSGRDQQARTEWSTAQRSFAAFGATLRADEAAALLGASPPTSVRGAVFRESAGLRTVRFAGSEVVLPDLTGFRYVARLLAQAGVDVHVLDLVGAREIAQPGIPVLDDEARAAYRRRLADVEEDLEEARRNDDLARIELAERDREYLLAELGRAVGLHGRARVTGGTEERARTSVARSVRYALDRLEAHHPQAAGHLRQAVRTGRYCRYQPDPVTPVDWAL